jgi:hypothetical protein
MDLAIRQRLVHELGCDLNQSAAHPTCGNTQLALAGTLRESSTNLYKAHFDGRLE